MIFCRLNEHDEVTFIHHLPFDPVYGMGKTEAELRNEGILVESIPAYEEIIGKRPVLKFKRETGGLYYEYIDRPLTPEEELQQLKERQALMQQALDDLLLGGM